MVLKPANFKASVEGRPVAVTDATDYRGPLRIVILIDVSGSMTEQGKLNFALVFARDLISVASSQTSLALLAFSDRIEATVPFGRGRPALLAEIDKLQDIDWARVKRVRRTALRDSLLNAVALLKEPGLGDAICLVTDGVDNASHASASKVDMLLESAGVRAYTAITAVDLNSRGLAHEEGGGPSDMRDLAAATGGDCVVFAPTRVLDIDWPAGWPVPIPESDRGPALHTAQAFYGEISSFARLDVRLPGPLVKPRQLKLEMVDASGRKNKNLQVIYPHQLAACAP